MRKQTLLLYSILFFAGCHSQVDIPLSQNHPAYGFYQTANKFNVAGGSCTKLNGTLEIRPDKIGNEKEYEKVRELAPGLLIVKQKSTEVEWMTVFFMEYVMAASIPKTCSWNLRDYPIEAADAVARSAEQK